MAGNDCKVNDESLNNLKFVKSNVESKKLQTSLLDLNDFALLRIFSWLNMKDSINFAETCVRLRKVGELNFTKYKQFDLLKYEHLVYVLENYYDRYGHYGYYDDEEDPDKGEEDPDEDEEDMEEPEPIEAEKVLSHIGKHITTLSIDSIWSTVRKAVMDNCVKIKSLKIYESPDFDSEWRTWIQNLNLESLTIQDCSNFNEMGVGLAALKELKFTDGNGDLNSMELFNVLEKTSDLESLQVELYYSDFKYAIFTKLPKLRCLEIKIESKDLVNLTESLKMDVLTELKVFLPLTFEAEGLKSLNSFLEILAEKSKLKELELYVSQVDKDTYRALNIFHLTTLRFYALVFVDHRCHDCCSIRQLVKAQPNLKHLDFLRKDVTVEHVVFVIKNLVNLETLRMDMEDLEELNESKIDEILKVSTSRPMLTLYINSDDRNSIKIEVRPNLHYKYLSLILLYCFKL